MSEWRIHSVSLRYVFRIHVLNHQKNQQLSDLQRAEHAKNMLTGGAQVLAEKYEDASEVHEQLLDRIETVLKKLQSRVPLVSEAERNMHKELLAMEEQLQMSTASIQQV